MDDARVPPPRKPRGARVLVPALALVGGFCLTAFPASPRYDPWGQYHDSIIVSDTLTGRC